MLPDWCPPGFVPLGLLGVGPAGAAWRVRDRVTGEVVCLRHLGRAASAATLDRVRSHIEALAGLGGAHILRPRAVVDGPHGPVLVVDAASGPSLGDLLTTRVLSAGEIVTVGVPVAQVLAALHGGGLAHGRVSAGNVLFDELGRPLLDLAAGDPTPGEACTAATAAGDVAALGALLRRAVADDASGALLAVLDAAVDPDPALRLDADRLAAALLAAATPLPVAFGHAVVARPALRIPDPSPSPSRHRRERRKRAAERGSPVLVLRLAAGLVVGVTALAVAGSAAAGARHHVSTPRPATHPPAASRTPTSMPTARPTTPPTPPPTVLPTSVRRRGGGMQTVLDRLDARWAHALRARDVTVLATADVPGSVASAADVRTIVELRHARLRPRGLRLVVVEARVTARRDAAVQLFVRDRRTAYALVDDVGHVVAHRPPRGLRTWRVTLRRTSAGWRIGRVTRG